MPSQKIFYYDEVTPEFLNLRKQIQKVFDKNDLISKKIRKLPNFKKQNYKNFDIKDFYLHHKENDIFFKQIYPLNSENKTIEFIMMNDLSCKILYPNDFFRE